jgi:hypothetical protein
MNEDELDGIPECPYCSDNWGMCDDPHLEDDRYFSLTLKEDYKYYMVISAHISFLTKHVSRFLF